MSAIDGTPVDDEALGEIDQVRRRVTRRAVARRAQRGLHHRGHRAFAAGPRDVHGAKGALGTSQPVEQCRDVLQPELDAELLEAEQPLDRIGEWRHGLI